MKHFVALFLFVSFFMLAVPVLLAQTPCTTLFGGGSKEDGSPYCLEEIQAQAASTGFQTPNDGMVQGATTSPLGQTNGSAGSPLKGGTYPAPSVNRQPNTGPEMLGLLALVPAAYAGWKLRKQTS